MQKGMLLQVSHSMFRVGIRRFTTVEVAQRSCTSYKKFHVSISCRRNHRESVEVSKEGLSYQVGAGVADFKKSFRKYMVREVVAKNLYECCSDRINHEDFFKTCNLPDTMQSWFSVMQIHVWMVLVRLRYEGRQGKKVSNSMVRIMWQDIGHRMILLGVNSSSDRNDVMKEYSQQFFGLIVAYDEGLVSHDRVLASALWRNMFAVKQNIRAESLALLVQYVRKQIQHIETYDIDDILLNGSIDWLPLIESDTG